MTALFTSHFRGLATARICAWRAAGKSAVPVRTEYHQTAGGGLGAHPEVSRSPVFLARKHARAYFPAGASSNESACDGGGAGDPGSIPGWGRSPGGGNGSPLPSSCLENPMDRGAWRAAVHRAHTESDMTELACTHMHTACSVSTERSFLGSIFRGISRKEPQAPCSETEHPPQSMVLREVWWSAASSADSTITHFFDLKRVKPRTSLVGPEAKTLELPKQETPVPSLVGKLDPTCSRTKS